MLIYEVSSEHVNILQEIHSNLSRAAKWSCLLTRNKQIQVDYKINYRVLLKRKVQNRM